ncbi:MAG: hypothetical protein JWO58_1119 [Chitinophagaceae bacterium]|nr:hypothetical protein [Chitinophagaceae bacterium]
MHFRTEVLVNKSLLHLHHTTSFLTIGSCFAEEIGSLLQLNKFNVLNNTLGTTFNPISIAILLEAICEDDKQALPVHTGDVWLDYRFHSSLYGYSEEELNQHIKQRLTTVRHQLQGVQPVCIVTLGTAWVYRLIKEDAVVANCHKQNSQLFQKELCSSQQMLASMKKAFDLLFASFPNCQVILTLSPVRHTKDGLEENQISKSLLRVLCHELHSSYQQVHYFPAYEMVLDDLRDYRFYAKDLVHPNELAKEYIWDKFRQSFFNTTTNRLIDQWQSIRQNILHKPFYDKSIQYKKFLERTLLDLEKISTELNVTEEILEIKKNIQLHA